MRALRKHCFLVGVGTAGPTREERRLRTPTRKLLMIGAALTGVFALGACTPNLPKPLPQPHASAPKPACTPGITLARFNSIQMGMTDKQVVSIFCGLTGKVQWQFTTPNYPSGQTTSIEVEYATGTPGNNWHVVDVDYENGHATSKFQYGL